MRGTDVSRTEAFADGVFGFGLTLLGVSSVEPPKTLDGVFLAVQGFIPFGLCFMMFYGLWSRHYIYCRRFGLEDTKVRVLTALMLFLVLAYLYPLRFLATLFVANVLHLPTGDSVAHITSWEQLSQLFVLYGAGIVAIQSIFYMLYLHAYKVRGKLALDELETLDAKWWTIEQGVLIFVPLTSIAIAYFNPFHDLQWAGWVYTLLGLVGWIHGSFHGKAHRAVVAKMDAEGRLDPEDLTDEDEVVEVDTP